MTEETFGRGRHGDRFCCRGESALICNLFCINKLRAMKEGALNCGQEQFSLRCMFLKAILDLSF